MTLDVVLHVGAGKTGTSVIQAALAQNRASLSEAGLSYPATKNRADRRAAAGGISSGNGKDLALLMVPQRRPPGFSAAATEAWIESSLREAGESTVLYSSEALQALTQAELAALDELFRRRGARIRVIYYVRHILDHAVARFSQNAKTGRIGEFRPSLRTLDGFVRAYESRTHRYLADFAQVLGQDRLTVRLFEHDRESLVARFLEAVGPGFASALPATLPRQVVNRSPNAYELELFLALNGGHDARRLCRALTDAMLNAPAAAAAPLRISADAFEAFAARNAAGVEEVNARFLPPESPLRLTSGRVQIGAPTVENHAEMTSGLIATCAMFARAMLGAGRDRDAA